MGDAARFGDLSAHLEHPPERPSEYSYASDRAFKAEQDAWWTDLLSLLDSFDAQDALAEEVLPYVRERASFRSIQTKHLPRTLGLDDPAQRSTRIGLRERFFCGEGRAVLCRCGRRLARSTKRRPGLPDAGQLRRRSGEIIQYGTMPARVQQTAIIMLAMQFHQCLRQRAQHLA